MTPPGRAAWMAAVACVAGAHLPAPANPVPAELPTVVVEGRRGAAPVAELPDPALEFVPLPPQAALSVAEALQRVAGVQIGRDRGEAAGVTVRGLAQVQTTLNGREVFTAGSGRFLDLADYPADMVSSVVVHRVGTAEQIEGGNGGLVDIRTQRPLELAVPVLRVSARRAYDDLAGRAEHRWSVLGDARWSGRAGDVGILLSMVRQRRAWREDQVSGAAPAPLTDANTGASVLAPGGLTLSASTGMRSRDAVNGMLQWRPRAGLDVFADASVASCRTWQDTYQLNLGTGAAPRPSDVELFAGTDDVRRIRWPDAPASVLSFARDTVERVASTAVLLRLQADRSWLALDVSRSASRSSLYFAGPQLAAQASYTYDGNGGVPSVGALTPQLADARQLQLVGIAYRQRPFKGRLDSVRGDAGYRFVLPWIETLNVGIRLAERSASNGSGTLISDDVLTPAVSLASRPSLISAYPYPSFFPGSAQALGHYVVGNLGLARDVASLRAAAGLAAAPPQAGSAPGTWGIRERTAALYLQAALISRALPLRAEIGLRLVDTGESVEGYNAVSGSAVALPVAARNDYRTYLPSASARYQLLPAWSVSSSAARTMARPDFDQLSPSLALMPYGAVSSSNRGSGGNPSLRAVTADNLDVALVHGNSAAAASVTVFHKRIVGLIGTDTRPEWHESRLYQVGRPFNMHRAHLTGAEMSYRAKLVDLPGWLSGFGTRATYSIIGTSSAEPRYDGRLPGVSPRSADMVVLYQRGPIDARLAYNWRDSFYSGGGAKVGSRFLSLSTRAYGWLDSEFSYQLTTKVKLHAQGVNLLRTVRRSSYGGTAIPGSAWLDGRQYTFGMSLSM